MPGPKSDGDVCRLWDALGSGMKLDRAAVVAEMSLPTARKYWRSGRMASEMKEPRTWRGDRRLKRTGGGSKFGPTWG